MLKRFFKSLLKRFFKSLLKRFVKSLSMDTNDIWTNIIIPLLIGPLFLYLKSIYDNYIIRKNEHKLMVYNNKYEHLTYVLNNFYWPLYLKLLCIKQLTYNIPLKNEYEYYSDDTDDGYDATDVDATDVDAADANDADANDATDDDSRYNIDNKTSRDSDNLVINIKTHKESKNIILNKETIQLMELNMNVLFDETLEIIEKHVYKARLCKSLNKNIVQFIKYCKIRQIIHEGSIDKKYNIEYFGIKDNTSKLLHLIEIDVNTVQDEYNYLIEMGP